MDNTPRRRTRSTGPSRAGTRSGRGGGAAHTPRVGRRAPANVASDAETVSTGAEKPSAQARTVRTRPPGTGPGTAPKTASNGGARRVRRITGFTVHTGGGESGRQTDRSKSHLAKQVAVLGLVFCAVAFALALPLRNYLAQRTELGATIAQESQLSAQLAGLEQEKEALSDPAYIAAEARRRLQYVKPGETIYQVNAPALAAPKPVGGPAAAAPQPWYAELWKTLADPTATVRPTDPAGTGAAPTSAVRSGTG